MHTRTSRKSVAGTMALGLTAALGIAVAAPGTAVADTGDRTQTTTCESLWVNDKNGATHARLRNCTVTWGKNIYDGSYWQTVRFELLDAATDGVCAKSNVIQSPAGTYAQASECNGVWTKKTASFNGRATNFFIRIGYGANSSYGHVYTNEAPPAGF
ncbi:hypothetical protein SRB5_11240 [Streptomyces sp. RB5]|uniref:Uncharacterized protein n=1 Tax=Streptomyces smaragdinus TaxID=2585196 RepID=A0A7K0CC38_9ACTN|nr:hypothetical protein [Streptomyces smaragdinus]MQY11010.1 hypothetical protein [Streptomyces smaragdinus]